MKALSIALLALSLASTAAADVLWLKNGRSLEGKVRTLPDGKIEIQQSFGSFSFSPDQIERVESAITLEEVVDQALETLAPEDAAGLFELAQWTQEQNAHTLSRDLMKAVLDIDPEHAEAHAALGHRHFQGQWVEEEDYRELRGEVLFRGEWVPREEKASILAMEGARSDRAHQQAYREAQLEIQAERLRRESRPQPPRYGPHSHGYPIGGYFGPVASAPVSRTPVPQARRPVKQPSKTTAPRAEQRRRSEPPRRRATGPRQTHAGHLRHQ
ncbi:MAG: hypothetical protein K0U98_23210 [Deltaproteobacteria bacterium]|nr:hypothetical protein [Deltaproteobacteria bacterium]